MYLKIVGSLFLLCSAAAIGFKKAEYLSQRVHNLRELQRMVVFLQGELRFHRSTLSDAFAAVSERVQAPFDRFLRELSQDMNLKGNRHFGELWQEEMQRMFQRDPAFQADRSLLEFLGSSLGYLDVTMQTEHLNLVLLQVEDALNQAKEQREMKGKLYQTMGVSVGALLVLLMI